LGIDSHVSQGMNGSWILLAAAMTIAVARVVFHVVRERALRPEHEIFAYLTLIGAISATVFAIGRCGGIAPFRYDLLSVLAAVGVSGWYLAVEPSRGLRAAWVLLVSGWIAVSVVGHARLWREYTTHPPYGVKRQIIRRLEAKGIRYGSSDYWI